MQDRPSGARKPALREGKEKPSQPLGVGVGLVSYLALSRSLQSSLCGVCSLARRFSVLQAHLGPSAMADDEKEAARRAAVHHAKEHAEAGEPTIFDKIISKQIPSTIVFEDEAVLAFRDISPQAPTHIILIPKVRDGLTQLAKADDRHEQILGRLMVTAAKVARQENLDQGFRLVVNDGPHGCQSVYHLHLHLIGGRQMNWPPG